MKINYKRDMYKSCIKGMLTIFVCNNFLNIFYLDIKIYRKYFTKWICETFFETPTCSVSERSNGIVRLVYLYSHLQHDFKWTYCISIAFRKLFYRVAQKKLFIRHCCSGMYLKCILLIIDYLKKLRNWYIVLRYNAAP